MVYVAKDESGDILIFHKRFVKTDNKNSERL